MSYELGIDAGTTYTAAAVHRDGDADIAPLGDHRAVIPSALYFLEDGSVLTGDVAVRRGLTAPDRVAARFKRRIGDTAPMVVGGAPHSAEALTARLLRWVVTEVSELEGGPPSSIVLTHPANWGPFKRDRLDQAMRLADLVGARTVTEPEAAAIYYASKERVEVGSVIAVYDLGGGTFDAAILRKTAGGWEILGAPEGIEQLGGIDFDEAVFAHVRNLLPEAFEELDEDDNTAVAAMARIRNDCVEAKEALSRDTEVSIPVLLPSVHTEVRLTRVELEAMLRPTLQETVGAMHRALQSARIDAGEVTAVLLVGGSSRIPLVSQLVSVEFGRPVAVDAHPKHAVALGAALAAGAPQIEPSPASGPPVEVDPPTPPPDATPTSPPSPPSPPSPSPPSPSPSPSPPPPPSPTPVEPAPLQSTPDDPNRRRWILAGAGLAVVVLVALVALFLLGDGDDDTGEDGEDDDNGQVEPPELAVGLRIPVGAFPDGIAVDQNGALWVASTTANEVTRIDPGSVDRSTVSVPAGSDPLAVTVADDGGVWVSLRNEDRVIRFDPDSMEITDSVEVGGRPSAFGLGAGSLWVVAADGEVDRLDPIAREVIAEIEVPGAAGIAVSNDGAWVTQIDQDTVAEINLETDTVVATISVGDSPDDIEIDDEGILWLANRGEGTVARLDSSSRQVTDVIDVGRSPANIDIDGDDIWVSDNGEGTAVLIDSATVAVSADVEVGDAPLDLVVDGERVWVSVTAEDEVVEVTITRS